MVFIFWLVEDIFKTAVSFFICNGKHLMNYKGCPEHKTYQRMKKPQYVFVKLEGGRVDRVPLRRRTRVLFQSGAEVLEWFFQVITSILLGHCYTVAE
mgnify:CR=1 FL=1